MAGELLQKIQKLKKIIIEKNNEEFGKAAVEVISPSKVDENALEPTGEEHTEGEHAEKEIEAEFLSMEVAIRKSISEEEEAAASYLKRAKEAMKHDQQPLYELYKELGERQQEYKKAHPEKTDDDLAVDEKYLRHIAMAYISI